ncbi:DNA-directed RNA polymerase I subunit 2 isoform X2 [Beta vulgaris subsp. vulgaris]|uniref:DNA-directed RNA polymerase I subunit 2 isoform X2 n=1 Tax=Beta vulgaris subsp. vulgaris TaxID=3555 RepID=UPI0020375A21|nr:DNA-directed RNA polymerase I subunit 2 isoform X2 [Beta vulgaris subsp. vulgaris]
MHPKMEKYPDFEHLEELFKPHIDSYDHFIQHGLEKMLNSIKPVEIRNSFTGDKLRISISNPAIFPPFKDEKGMAKPLRPYECRQAKISYSTKLKVDLCFQYNSGPIVREKYTFGQFPVMLKSKICHLRNVSPRKLVSYKEEPAEMGGYFIMNGIERIVRLLIMQKRNYPMSLVRSSFRVRREGYTDKAVVIRCVREDESAVTVKLYYLNNGSARLGFWIGGREFLLPVGIVLKALIETTDHEIYVALTCSYNEKYEGVKGAVGTQLLGERAKIILDELHGLSLLTRRQCVEHIGQCFQPVMDGLENESYRVVGEAVLNDFIFVHLGSKDHKFNLLIFMLQKLFSLVDQTSVPDNPDALQNQEVLQVGPLISVYLKDKLQDWLYRSKKMLNDEMSEKGEKFDLGSLGDVKKLLNKTSPTQIGTAMENLLKTGRLATQSGLDLPQRAGFVIQADRINFLRFLSNFRAVHRGASLAGARNTSVRKLLPESWGFLCPVHTPDGEPCGLLNHLTCTCRITSFFDPQGVIKDFFTMRLSIIKILVKMGMKPSLPKLAQAGPPEVLSVLLDGEVIGTIPSGQVEELVKHLRRLKLSAATVVPNDLEVGYVPLSFGGAYPGLFLFTNPSRFIRPVKNISIPPEDSNNIELLGPFEQVYMEIRCPDGGDGGRGEKFPATHEEIHPTGILSVVANLTPWSNHNQSPRNMYQCQMAKQTMAFSSQSIKFRTDQKSYHLQTPQSPIVRTSYHNKYCVDEYPSGTNAIVAVLAYTGYDMEDAMILNKSSVDRGMCHAQIYQTDTVDLTEEGSRSDRTSRTFRRSTLDKSTHSLIDVDGLPYLGQMIHPDEPYCSVYDSTTGKFVTRKLKGSEPAVVDYVAVDGKNKSDLQKVNIRLRRPRNPIIGDKFSSRHGQKGVCSRLWPDIDMPFSQNTGMRPDLIINPHAFPSRMTIAMLLESIAAKGGSLHGKFVDATPFEDSLKKAGGRQGSESSSLVDDLGSMLTAQGFDKFGTEVLYSGVYGTELTCEIFIGPVYYQRLRHMVSDKFQVRSTGTVDSITRQPIKGRKRGGGVRFGEMERDAMLAHGAAYLLHDRLHKSSDYHVADVCSLCGSMLSTTVIESHKPVAQKINGLPPPRAPKKVSCHSCQTSKGMETVAMPYVFRYLAAELAAMNIKMTLKLSNGAGA